MKGEPGMNGTSGEPVRKRYCNSETLGDNENFNSVVTSFVEILSFFRG